MRIYIKDMEMPVTCCHCPLMGYDPDIEWADGGRETQGAYICVITHELIDSTKREDHCPIVPAPPHGRLIDADALIADLKRQCREVFRIDAVSPNDFWINRNEAYNQKLWQTWCEGFYDYLGSRQTIIEAEEGE